jgi:putative Mg2+ transporter-C (MgtC) family protein
MSNGFDFLKLGSTHIPEAEIAGRLLLAALFAAAIGFEREMRKEPAGLRTPR